MTSITLPDAILAQIEVSSLPWPLHIDDMLRAAPLVHGESRGGNRRIFIQGNLAVIAEVFPAAPRQLSEIGPHVALTPRDVRMIGVESSL